MEPTRWTQLSISSQRALLWASALAKLREGGFVTNTSSIEINAFDILIGMILEHPKDAEPLILLQHFNLTPGQILPTDFPRLSKEIIERNLLSVTSESAMQLDPEAYNIVDAGINLGINSGSPQVVELRAIFAAMLEITNPVTMALIPILDGLGTSLSEVSQTTREYVVKNDGKESYEEFLNKRHPFNPKPIDIPNYKADHGQQYKLGNDLVGIRAEVDAFAYLLASRGLNPPLAVGLFGDWGSGKSFFMESVRNRIEQLIQDPKVKEKRQSEVPFWKRIIQIEFNAWHYMEGELWASLVDHIFNQLRMEGDTEDIIKKRRDYWLKQLRNTRSKIISLESNRNIAEKNLSDKERAAENLSLKRDLELKNMVRLKEKAASNILIKQNLEELRESLKPLFITIGIPTPDEVFNKIDEANREFKRGRALINALWSDTKKRWIAMGTLISIPVLVLILSLFNVSTVVTAFSGLSAMIGAVFALVGKALKIMKSQLDSLEKTEIKIKEEIVNERNALNEEIKNSETEVVEAEKQLKTVLEEKKNLINELENYQKELDDVTPVRVLNDFVTERIDSGDYRKLLGIPALIQQDFRQLAKLIAVQNVKIIETKDENKENDFKTFNRIILYIDDLDRCPDEHVIKVLQAVHLLLAFELFVVVVAVDSRWLSHSLTKHFEALSVNNNNGTTATPDDYLEKIFQIPFWIKPLGESSKKNIIQGLLYGHLAGNIGNEVQESDLDKPTVGEDQIKILTTLDPTNTPPTLQTVALSITNTELKFLYDLVPLLGTTPRSTKRFVNLYQLIRIIYHLDPENDLINSPKEHELLAFVLALGEGLPKLGPAVFNESLKSESNENLESIIVKIKPNIDNKEIKCLENWLAIRNEWLIIPAERLAKAYSRIDRFLFRIATINDKKWNEN